ncbi:MAG: zinc ABC transporter substrate-binding protein [Anaerolineaceae bacterium]
MLTVRFSRGSTPICHHHSGLVILAILIQLVGLTACQTTPPTSTIVQPPRVLVVESFLADISRNVAGNRLTVESLIPNGMDPHTFEPTPRDVVKIANSQVLIVNGAGLESWLSRTLANSGRPILVIEASSGLTPRKPAAGELVDEPTDPHFWLDPLSVIKYGENIREGLCQVDPDGCDIYRQNAEGYISELEQLDRWIKNQVTLIPPEGRLLITNHESFGYYADRYGFQIVGTIIPSVSTEAIPTALQLSGLIQKIKSSGAKAIFLEAGTNPQLAETIAAETGVVIITDLLTHTLTSPDGPAPTYITMMHYDTQRIVNALK